MTPKEEEFYYLINGREPDKMYNYHCLVCKYEEEVPEICVDELGDYEEIELEDGTIEYHKAEGMPILICPNCDADFYYKDGDNK